MTSPTLGLAPIPFTYFTDNSGKPCMGGKLYTRYANNIDVPFATYNTPVIDPIFLNPNPIILDGTGTNPFPIYFVNNGSDLYYCFLTDANDNVVREWSPFPVMYPASGSGPTPDISLPNVNYATNGQFHYNYPVSNPVQSMSDADIAGNTDTYFTIARGNWVFVTDQGAVNDSITFPPFPLSSTSPSYNPSNAFTYVCNTTGALQARRDLMIFFNDVKAFENENITVSCWATSNQPANFEVFVHQYPGIGGSGANDYPVSPPIAFTNSWAFSEVKLTVPSTSLMTPGVGGFMGIGFRFGLNLTGQFQFTNIMIQRGNNPIQTYIYGGSIYDYANNFSSSDGFVTGDVKYSALQTNTMPGWLLMDDGTLGSVASAATHQGNKFFNLYSFLWNQNFNWLNDGNPKGGTALIDWKANRKMNLPASVGRTFYNAGRPNPTVTLSPTDHAYGTIAGSQLHVNIVDEMAPHNHQISALGFADKLVTGTSGTNWAFEGGVTHPSTDNKGGGIAYSIENPSSYINAFIKL